MIWIPAMTGPAIINVVPADAFSAPAGSGSERVLPTSTAGFAGAFRSANVITDAVSALPEPAWITMPGCGVAGLASLRHCGARG
jgi:hypothetical protein